MSIGRVVITGTKVRPALKLIFHPSEVHPRDPELPLSEWVEKFIVAKYKGSARWDRRQGCWVVTATGPNPDLKFQRAGFTLDFSEADDPSLADVLTLNELADPLTKLDGNRVHVIPRLMGYDRTKELLGIGAAWDKANKWLTIPVSDIMHQGTPRPGINWRQNALDAARASLGRIITPAELAAATAAAGEAKDIAEMDDADVAQLINQVGDIPDWFGLDLFPFQRIGAIAVAAGHRGLFDQPGLGKTRQSIAAAAILKSRRTVITCLPVGLTGWEREVLEAGLHTLGGELPGGKIVVIRAGKKEPETLPETGVIITSDSLLTSRPELRRRVMAWQPEVFVYDEAHRGKTFDSERSKAMLQLAGATTKAPIAVTGTPLFANPSELAPLLEFTGHLSPIFGGKAAYLERYCKFDHFGRLVPRKENLGELRAKLSRHVWVRRRKREVLPDLPATLLSPKWVDVPLTEYRRAYKDVSTTLKRWVTEYQNKNGGDPDEQTIRDFAASQIGLISALRRAAGLAKIPAVVADIRNHVMETREMRDGQWFYPRPLIVWAHHIEVSDALSAAVPQEVTGTGIIRGGVSHDVRDQLVRDFQANKIPVLVCSIAAAGVAITLTASSDMFFAESDWTPAAIRQALDRAERIGQTSEKILATTYLAAGTLDPRIQQVLKMKSKILDKIYGDDNDVSVFDGISDVESATDLVVSLINDILNPGGGSE